MSRSGYCDDFGEQWAMIMWRGAVRSAIRGRRGQAFLREMRDALDAMPVKRLIACDLVTPDGECCALGAVAVKRGLDVSGIDPEDRDVVAHAFGVAEALAAEVAYLNDECGPQHDTPEKRWQRMRDWVERQIQEAQPPAI